MANEVAIIELINGGEPIQVTVADGGAIAKGTLIKLADPRTGSATSASADPCIGIAAEEKVASNGVTTLTVYTRGIFDIKDSGAGFNAGAIVCVGGANLIRVAIAAELLTGTCIGRSLETASASEVVAVLVNI